VDENLNAIGGEKNKNIKLDRKPIGIFPGGGPKKLSKDTEEGRPVRSKFCGGETTSNTCSGGEEQGIGRGGKEPFPAEKLKGGGGGKPLGNERGKGGIRVKNTGTGNLGGGRRFKYLEGLA